MLVFIIACAVPFGWIVATSQAPMKLAALMMSIYQGQQVLILAIINVALLFIGCFMETTAILLIATPTLFRSSSRSGIDPVHFGIIMVVNLLIGALTPPFGVILFIMMDIAKISLGAIVARRPAVLHPAVLDLADHHLLGRFRAVRAALLRQGELSGQGRFEALWPSFIPKVRNTPLSSADSVAPGIRCGPWRPLG